LTKGDKKICLNKADSELYVICDVQNSGDVEKQIDACGKKGMIVHIESISPG